MASVSNGGHVTLGVKSGGCAGFEYIWGLSTDDGIELMTMVMNAPTMVITTWTLTPTTATTTER